MPPELSERVYVAYVLGSIARVFGGSSPAFSVSFSLEFCAPVTFYTICSDVLRKSENFQIQSFVLF